MELPTSLRGHIKRGVPLLMKESCEIVMSPSGEYIRIKKTPDLCRWFHRLQRLKAARKRPIWIRITRWVAEIRNKMYWDCPSQFRFTRQSPLSKWQQKHREWY